MPARMHLIDVSRPGGTALEGITQMNASASSAGLSEQFDGETLALLDELDVEIPDFVGLDLDVVFGTPLEMYEPAGTRREMRAYAAAIVAAPSQSYELSLSHGAEIQARVDAARDILADDPTITARVRERLVDVFLPYAAQLRTSPVTAAPLLVAA
ncbi:hypothetical protein SHJG_p1074 (plasmid) [Streptomyces hygroscopicus subsp. jinggangensis 5008]|nr:hypothetical protein SHJG_p1074 [Streptomyces hygroscopicus subsp. jinggangensis 5008]AGF68359.1 hypothetical protein SHJGH_p1074 [Streptomyces hygroscopicus subsp. jinggangensis TL01]